VPPDEPANVVAESLYRRLNMDARDLLIVFNSRQVYGKSLALKGHPEAFQQALAEAKPAFRQYYAKGLAEYAKRLEARISPGAGSTQAPGTGPEGEVAPASPTDTVANSPPVDVRRGGGSWGRVALVVLVLAILVVGLAVGVSNRQRVGGQERIYQARLTEATDLLSEAAIEADRHPVEAHNDRLAELSERLEELRRSPQREDTRAVDLLVGDARGLLVDVRKEGRQAERQA
jgi:hypothetical protein